MENPSSLNDILNKISEQDKVYIEKEAEELAALDEEDAAGRITARGFADELRKLAEGPAGMGAMPAMRPHRPVGGAAKPPAASVAGAPGNMDSRKNSVTPFGTLKANPAGPKPPTPQAAAPKPPRPPGT